MLSRNTSWKKRKWNERMAVNTRIQGTAADIVKIAMLKMRQAIEDAGLDAKILLQIHDELVIEVRDDQIAEMKDLMKDVMEHAVELDVPLTVTLNTAKDWGSLK